MEATLNDPRCVPIKLHGPIPVGDEIAYPDYTSTQHETWAKLYARQEKLLPGRAADEFLTGLRRLGLTRDRMPALADVSARLHDATGWRIARAPGLLDAGDFFGYLAQRIFPCTDYVRRPEELDYTPAPDCFHDIFGHTPMIVHPRFAEFYQKIGQAAVACHDAAQDGVERDRGDSVETKAGGVRRPRPTSNHVDLMEGVTRIYWFTVEFGLVRSAAGLRIYGNGIISSSAETLHCTEPEVKKVDFTPAAAAAQPYDIWHFQDVLFVIDDFDQLEREFDAWASGNGLTTNGHA